MTNDLIPGSAERDATHACDVLAMLCGMPVDAVRDAVASRAACTPGACWMALVAMVRCHPCSAAGCLPPINLQMGSSSPMPRTLIC